MQKLTTDQAPAAYGGEGWSPRGASTESEIGRLWAPHAVDSEYRRLRAVLLHEPGDELAAGSDPDAVLMLEPVDAALAASQHAAMAEAYRAAGVEVLPVRPAQAPPPNQMFVADLMFMTPAGVLVARPASSVRAGEERWVARRLADLGVPVLRTVAGPGTFEGADAAWLDPCTVLIGVGLRTNRDGVAQVAETLAPLGVDVVACDLPWGTMHLMGQLRIVDRDLALVWRTRIAQAAVQALRERGFRVEAFPDEVEARRGYAHNFVVLGPRHILMPTGAPETQAFYEGLGIRCETVDVSELLKAAGGIGCLTGVVAREGEEE
jgi:arginine deiminase